MIPNSKEKECQDFSSHLRHHMSYIFDSGSTSSCRPKPKTRKIDPPKTGSRDSSFIRFGGHKGGCYCSPFPRKKKKKSQSIANIDTRKKKPKLGGNKNKKELKRNHEPIPSPHWQQVQYTRPTVIGGDLFPLIKFPPPHCSPCVSDLTAA